LAWIILDAALDFPSRKFPSIHIAGSNGKGSVSTKVAAGLQFAGWKVGLYTSPHIASFTERVRINGQAINPEEVVGYLEAIFTAVDHDNIAATFFEITTLLAFCHFAEQKVDYAVIETGIGGTYDSTNIIKPQLCAITSLSLEHTDLLGSTLEAIAREKAGIIKLATPVVLGPRVPYALIAPFVDAMQATCYCVEGSFADFHCENNAVAGKCLELLNIRPDAIKHGLNALPPCRLEIVPPPKASMSWPPEVILDVAHNPDGLENLFKAVRLRHPDKPIRLVFGLSYNKDVRGCLAILQKYGSAFHLIAADHERAVKPAELYESLKSFGVTEDSLFATQNLPQNCSIALEMAISRQELLVICGTFFIMAAVRRHLGIIDLYDSIDLN
jgi:dihydrofolate synthase / folylpolyglutamate synthase